MMERLLGKKRVTAFFFLIFLLIFSVINIQKELPLLKEAAMEWYGGGKRELGELVTKVNSVIDENVPGRYGFIDVYGYIQLLLGKEEESNFEVVKDTEGKLHYTYFTNEINDTTKLTKRAGRLAEELEGTGSELVYVMPPEKVIIGHTQFPRGIPYHMANETADDFLDKLAKEGVNSLDLRDYLADSGLNMSEVFFNTDHHWRIETAFWAATQFCDWMEESYGEVMDPEGYFKDKSHYNFVTYEDLCLGSMGRKTGRFYTKVDDFTLIFPKFGTNYRYENSISEDLEFIGRFEEALIATPVIRNSQDPYATDLYGIYLYGNPGFSHIENLDQPEGISICLIKDSFAVPFAAFTSLRCRSVDMIDPRDFEGDYIETLKEGEYDYVILMFSPQNLVEEFFPFCEEAQEQEEDGEVQEG